MNHNYEYLEVAERILDRIKKCNVNEAAAITTKDLVELVGANSGLVNCYPGFPDNACCRKAFFISLTSNRYISSRGGGHLTFRKALEVFVRHMQGYCKGRTEVAIFIIDSWDPDSFSEWQSNIEQIKKEGAHVIFLQITGDKVTPLNL